MQNFNEIIDTLKQITGTTTDKAIAIELHIKSTTFASMKRRQRIPYAAILKYCHNRRIDTNIVLLDKPEKEETEGIVTVRYYRDITANA